MRESFLSAGEGLEFYYVNSLEGEFDLVDELESIRVGQNDVEEALGAAFEKLFLNREKNILLDLVHAVLEILPFDLNSVLVGEFDVGADVFEEVPLKVFEIVLAEEEEGLEVFGFELFTLLVLDEGV